MKRERERDELCGEKMNLNLKLKKKNKLRREEKSECVERNEMGAR